MAMTIVEELWTRIRAAIDDKIVAAEDAAVRAEGVADSTHWQDDRLSVMGQLGPSLKGPKGDKGDKGDSGDGAGDVLWSELNPVLDGKAAVSHDHTALQISDATTVGRAVLTASDAAAARGAIGAGTSNLAVGTTSSTAKAGNYQPTAANITDATTVGRNVLKAADAAAARTAIGAGTSNLALGTTAATAAAGNHTHSQYAASSRVTALEGSQPIIVSSLPASPLPGRIYLVTG